MYLFIETNLLQTGPDTVGDCDTMSRCGKDAMIT